MEYFCFNCQKNVKPFKLIKWHVCPHCKRFMNDDGSGFYRICDRCGANMPANAEFCLKCGHNLINGNDENITFNQLKMMWYKNLWKNSFIAVLMLILAVLFIFGLLYISFYVAIFAVVFAIGAAILKFLLQYFGR